LVTINTSFSNGIITFTVTDAVFEFVFWGFSVNIFWVELKDNLNMFLSVIVDFYDNFFNQSLYDKLFLL